jgi:NADH:ubiquinone oxidoreductase subunit 4 (subunit M)
MYQSPDEEKRAGKTPDAAPALSLTDRVVLAALMVLLVWLGVYPAPLIRMIQAMAARLV